MVTLQKISVEGQTAIKSKYAVLMDDGNQVGEVWRVAGRSFSGAWHWSRADGSNGVRCMTREDAIAKVVGT